MGQVWLKKNNKTLKIKPPEKVSSPSQLMGSAPMVDSIHTMLDEC